MSVVPAEKKLTDSQLEDLAKNACIDVNVLKAFCEVEGGGIGFSDVTGRMIIRFEESHFKNNHKGEERDGAWEQKIVNQTSAWAAFLDAATIDKKAAMLSTSVGLMQVMVENFRSCNFKDAEDMWQYNEVSESNQVETGIRFIMADPILYKALKNKSWSIVAEHYNGKGFRELAARTNSTPYDKRMQNAFVRFTNQANGLHRTTQTVNLRSGNGTQFPVIDVLRVNTYLSITGKFQDWRQVKVVATEKEGWVNSKYIS